MGVPSDLEPRGWTRKGRKGSFRYCDERGHEINDAQKIARVEALAIPPAWKRVWISPRPTAKLQATGYDAAGRKQYLYHPDFRAQQEEAKYAKLIRFGERLPALRQTMLADLDREALDERRVCAVALRLINLGWFRVGSDQYARESHTYGITTLTRRHVSVRGRRVRLDFTAKHGVKVRSTLVDKELAAAMKELVALPGGARVFRFEDEDGRHNLTCQRLNAYVKAELGTEFSAKDFRTWGGTLVAAIALAEEAQRNGFPESQAQERRVLATVFRRVGEELGNSAAIARSSYVSPAVVEQFLRGTTLADFRPKRRRVTTLRLDGLDPEEQALLSLLRSWRQKAAQPS